MQNYNQYLVAGTCGFFVPLLLVMFTHIWSVFCDAYVMIIFQSIPQAVAAAQVMIGFF